MGLRLDAGGLGFARTGHVEDEVVATERTEPVEDAVEMLREYHEVGLAVHLAEALGAKRAARERFALGAGGGVVVGDDERGVGMGDVPLRAEKIVLAGRDLHLVKLLRHDSVLGKPALRNQPSVRKAKLPRRGNCAAVDTRLPTGNYLRNKHLQPLFLRGGCAALSQFVDHVDDLLGLLDDDNAEFRFVCCGSHDHDSPQSDNPLPDAVGQLHRANVRQPNLLSPRGDGSTLGYNPLGGHDIDRAFQLN